MLDCLSPSPKQVCSQRNTPTWVHPAKVHAESRLSGIEGPSEVRVLSLAVTKGPPSNLKVKLGIELKTVLQLHCRLAHRLRREVLTEDNLCLVWAVSKQGLWLALKPVSGTSDMENPGSWAGRVISSATGLLCSGSRPAPAGAPARPSTVHRGPGPLQLQSSRPPPSLYCPASHPTPQSLISGGAMATKSTRPWQPKEPQRGVPG